MQKIPFDYVGGHLMEIAAKVNGESHKFLLDTGIGLTVVFKSFAEEIGLGPTGEFSGKRMSGQELRVPLASVPEMEVGGFLRKDAVVGIYDMTGLPPSFSEIKGILAINYFRDRVLTFDYKQSSVIVSDEPIVDGPIGNGTVVPVSIEYDGPAITLFINAYLPNGRAVKLEVDTGSDTLILDSRFMADLGVSGEDPSVETFTGTDETSFNYKRYLYKVNGRLGIAGAPDIFQENPRIVFQDIIHDGLLGNDFLKRFTVAYDLVRSSMTFYRV